MAKYIDKAALVAEIERRRNESWLGMYTKEKGIIFDITDDILSFIDTLEVKKVDLDSEITLWANAIPEIRLNDVERLATYFFELGLKTK